MIEIAKKPQSIPDIGFTLYADDITIWANEESRVEKEEAFEEATNFVGKLAEHSGLQWALKKSKVIRIHGPRYVRPGNIMLGDHTIPKKIKQES